MAEKLVPNMDREFTFFFGRCTNFVTCPLASIDLSVGLFFTDSRSFFWKEIHESDKISFSRCVPCGM